MEQWSGIIIIVAETKKRRKERVIKREEVKKQQRGTKKIEGRKTQERRKWKRLGGGGGGGEEDSGHRSLPCGDLVLWIASPRFLVLTIRVTVKHITRYCNGVVHSAEEWGTRVLYGENNSWHKHFVKADDGCRGLFDYPLYQSYYYDLTRFTEHNKLVIN